MNITIKQFSNTTKKTNIVGNVDIDFEKGELSGGNSELISAIKDYFAHGGDELFETGEIGYALHAQSPCYILTDPFHDKAQFKALLSCMYSGMGLHSDDLSDVEMPKSTWDDNDPLEGMDDEIKKLVVY